MNTFKKDNKNFLIKSVRFLFEKLIKPKSGNEDVDRREFVLNVFLVTSVFFTFLAFLSVLQNFMVRGNGPQSNNPFYLFLIFLFFVFLLVLSRRGFVNFSSYLFILTYFLPISHGVYTWGANQPQTLLSFTLVVVMAGVLISSRFAFFVTVCVVSVIMIFTYLQVNEIISLSVKDEVLRFKDAIAFSVMFFIISVVSWLSNREIEKSLKRARFSENELKKERDLLEVRVEERTKDLKKAQLERAIQLQRFAEFGKMTGGLLHDIVNPLTATLLNLEDLKKTTESNENVSHINNALGNIDRIKKIIKTGRTQLQKQKVKTFFYPEQEVRQVLGMLSFGARENNVVLDLDSSDKNIELYGDVNKFSRVIAGIVSNAIDSYCNLDSFKEERNKVFVRIFRNKDNLKIRIQDWGCGITNDNLSKIFNPLFTTKDVKKGTGMGLMICKEIIENDFGGKILVQSKDGVGSLFTIKLPIKKIDEKKQKHRRCDK